MKYNFKLPFSKYKLKPKVWNSSPTTYNLQATTCSGFTFVELIIVLSIFAVLSSVVLFNFTDFSSNAKLQNLVQDVALQIRQAQLSGSSGRIPPQAVSGLNSQILPDVASGAIKISYGIHFDINTPRGFAYFSDFEQIGYELGTFDNASIFNDPLESFTCLPDTEFDDECIDVLIFPPEFIISKIEVFDGSNTFSTPDDFSTLDITFTRPRQEATFITDPTVNGTIISAKITFESSRGQKRSITVTRLGQISAE